MINALQQNYNKSNAKLQKHIYHIITILLIISHDNDIPYISAQNRINTNIYLSHTLHKQSTGNNLSLSLSKLCLR